MKETGTEWFYVADVDRIDSPALLIYKDRVKENIARAIALAGSVNILRPHVKTSKMAEVNRMMTDMGINKFKCATIAEAEMLASIGAHDVLIAYQLVGPKVDRFIELVKKFPSTTFSCLTDNLFSAEYLSDKARKNHIIIHVYIDLNTGMNRSGIPASQAAILYRGLRLLEGIDVRGLHAYDGHIRDTDPDVRQKRSDEAFAAVESLKDTLTAQYGFTPAIIAGGSPTFPTHVKRKGVECSPGTFVFWDHGYKKQIPDQPFDYAALVMTRVVSVIDANTICTDLGYKGIASENPLPRMHFFNAPGASQSAQSEEHLVLRVTDASQYKPGDVLYAAPIHICPTVALYDTASVIEDHRLTGEWKVTARDRKITI